jgi:feruloyl esterase
MPSIDAAVGWVDAVDPDLRAFKAHGGKLLLYAGWRDTGISPENTVHYYESVLDEMGEQQSDWLRLFMVPGMEHCGGGPGPNAFGGPFALPAPTLDADHDVLSALERWVERGKAPSKIIATKYAGDNPAGAIALQRPLCPYPKAAVYNGKGSGGDPRSFKCRAEDEHDGDERDDDD